MILFSFYFLFFYQGVTVLFLFVDLHEFESTKFVHVLSRDT